MGGSDFTKYIVDHSLSNLGTNRFPVVKDSARKENASGLSIQHRRHFLQYLSHLNILGQLNDLK